MSEQKIVFQGELQLTRWSESSANGATVTFWVHPEDLESFKVMKARSGKTPGMRLGVVMVAIGDDEQVIEHAPAPSSTPAPTPRRVPRPHMGDLGMIAVRWCRDKDFWRWVAEQVGFEAGESVSKEFILQQCGAAERDGSAASRKHLDADPDCAQLFHQRIRIPFHDWLIEQGIQK